MSKGRSLKPRCQKCALHQELCICQNIPKLDFQHQYSIFQSAMEYRRPTSSGSFFYKNFKARNYIYGRKDVEFNPNVLDSDFDSSSTYLVFPHKSSILLSDLPKNKALQFVFVDGTWSEASRLQRRLKLAARFQIVDLSPSFKYQIPAKLKLRNESREGGISTLEAILSVMKHCESLQNFELLKGTYLHFLKQYQIMRGTKFKTDVQL